MTDENTCTVDGVEYVASETMGAVCAKCAGYESIELCEELGQCSSIFRKDKRNIDWIKKDDK